MIRIPLVCVRLSCAGLFSSFEFELIVKWQSVWFYILFSNSWLRLNLSRSIIVWRCIIRVYIVLSYGFDFWNRHWGIKSRHGIRFLASPFRGLCLVTFCLCKWFQVPCVCGLWSKWHVNWNALAGLSVCLFGGYCYSQSTAAAATNTTSSSSTFSGKIIVAAILSLGCILHWVFHTLHVKRHSRHASRRVVGVLSMFTGSLHDQQVAKP